MAKGIFIYSRTELPADAGEDLEIVCRSIAPDNIEPREPAINIGNGVAWGVMNPPPALLSEEGSLLLGMFYNGHNEWNIPSGCRPDGSYALFRSDDRCCEVITDRVGSRTVWYYLDSERFIASTSQRAIIIYLASYEPDKSAIPWVLSSGTLGPCSWDRRIKRLPPDSSLLICRKNWELKIDCRSRNYSPERKNSSLHKKSLRNSIEETFSSLKLDYSDWVLPLSGGYDSRGILAFLPKKDMWGTSLRTVTWGLKSSEQIEGNDALVAKKLSETAQLPHKYYHTDMTGEEIDKIIDRFIILGEGRVDHLSGYMDGLSLWRDLFNDGVNGIIRGDEGFGGDRMNSNFAVRFYQGYTVLSDYSNLHDNENFGFPRQHLQAELLRRKDESLKMWCDRLNLDFQIPVMMAALSDLKLSYVEQITPLLSGKILDQVYKLPDRLRFRKPLFKKIVEEAFPGFPFATSSANSVPGDILRKDQVKVLIAHGLNSDDARGLLGKNFTDRILRSLAADKGMNSRAYSLRKAVSRIVPQYFKNSLRNFGGQPALDNYVIAFRAYIAVRMAGILRTDSGLLKNSIIKQNELNTVF